MNEETIDYIDVKYKQDNRIGEEIDLRSLEDHVIGIHEAIYQDGSTKQLEHCLEEALAILNIDLELGKLQVTSKTPSILDLRKAYGPNLLCELLVHKIHSATEQERYEIMFSIMKETAKAQNKSEFEFIANVKELAEDVLHDISCDEQEYKHR